MNPNNRGNPNLPSQRRRRVPFSPGMQPDVTHFPAVPDAPVVAPYVVSTFDARPINTIDFQTQSGTDSDDTGWDGAAGPYGASSIFYVVPQGRVAIVRNFQILAIPATGQEVAGSDPIFLANGASNFKVNISILINDNYVEGMVSIVCWSLAFGDYFGDVYILANPGDVIELRVTSNFSGAETAGSSWHQMLMSMQGNLLLAMSDQLEFAPGTTDVLPVSPIQERK